MVRDFAKSTKFKSRALVGKVAIAFVLLAILSLVFLSAWFGLVWNGKTRLTLLSANPVVLVSYDPAEKVINVIPFPEAMVVPVSYGYGNYRASKVHALDVSEGKNGKLFLQTFENVLGVPIAGSITTNLKGSGLEGFRSGLDISKEIILGRIKVGLGFWDSALFFLKIISVGSDGIRVVDLSEGGLVSAQTEPDGGVAISLVGDRWDRWVRSNFVDPEVMSEGLTVSVVNKTSHQGLGSNVARIVENLGARVIQVRSGDGESAFCAIGSSVSFKDSETVTILSDMLGCKWNEFDTANERAELVVEVGEDLFERLIP